MNASMNHVDWQKESQFCIALFKEKCPELDLAEIEFVRNVLQVNQYVRLCTVRPLSQKTPRKSGGEDKKEGGRQKNKLSKKKFNFKQVCTKVNTDI